MCLTHCVGPHFSSGKVEEVLATDFLEKGTHIQKEECGGMKSRYSNWSVWDLWEYRGYGNGWNSLRVVYKSSSWLPLPTSLFPFSWKKQMHTGKVTEKPFEGLILPKRKGRLNTFMFSFTLISFMFRVQERAHSIISPSALSEN